MNETFKPASMAGVAIVWTLVYIGGFLLFAGRAIVPLTSGAYPELFDVGAALILLGFIIFALLRAVKSYRISDGELYIDRVAIKGVTVPLSSVKSVQAQPDIGSFFNTSMFGTGGIFGWGGKARVRNPSDVHALEAYVYGSNPKHSIVMRLYDDRHIIVTPADVQGFLTAIRNASNIQAMPAMSAMPSKATPSANPPAKKRRR